MATKSHKVTVEVLIVGAEIVGVKLQPHLVKTVPLHRPKFAKAVGHVRLELRA